MLNEPGNPNIEAFDGAVPKLTIRSFDRLKPTTLASWFRISLNRDRTAVGTPNIMRPRSFDTGQISDSGDPGKASYLNLRRERIVAKDVRQQQAHSSWLWDTV